jgi:outer membrane lipoprotein SlyB
VKALLATLVVGSVGHCYAQDMLKVSRTAWQALSNEERAAIQATRLVDVRDPGTFGVVADNQGIDESTPGTTGGAALGGAVAQAAYIDRAFKPGNNYFAKNQLAVGILGAIIGSSLDKAPVQQFHFRYAIKVESGDFQTIDAVQASPFRHPVGLCVSLPELIQQPQGLCTNTGADLRRLYASLAAVQSQAINAPQGTNAGGTSTMPSPAPVMCKLGNLAPVPTTEAKCKAIGGEST